ncbi:hypothetical protein HanXRQr2_Chr13g0588691 [Helianthus annuus]|uniref:Uncharacterized protein n=1 Tax=Helianthus annuus TaxID=4232 RepID=A0A9K3EGX2_HELAN|nr:hypothetical protein HanXRQr2_Chr13g0588691 [Helianthus annuus]
MQEYYQRHYQIQMHHSPFHHKTSIIFVMPRMHTYGDLWLHIVM